MKNFIAEQLTKVKEQNRGFYFNGSLIVESACNLEQAIEQSEYIFATYNELQEINGIDIDRFCQNIYDKNAMMLWRWNEKGFSCDSVASEIINHMMKEAFIQGRLSSIEE